MRGVGNVAIYKEKLFVERENESESLFKLHRLHSTIPSIMIRSKSASLFKLVGIGGVGINIGGVGVG